MIHNLCITR